MANLLKYSRNRCTTVEQIDEHTLRSMCRLQDMITDAFVELTVRLPDLEITGARGNVSRNFRKGVLNPTQALQKVIGIRIGPGMTKIIKGLIGDESDYRQLSFMVEECCHGVILSFTKDVLLSSPRPKELDEAKEYYANMVKENVRLYNRCAAFAPGSSLVEGIDPPK